MMTSLKNQIMFGVYTMYVVRKIKNPYVFPLLAVGGFFAFLSFLISVPSVISNLILAGGSYYFLSDAFSKADAVVQIVLCLFLISLVLYLKKVGIYTIDVIKERFV